MNTATVRILLLLALVIMCCPLSSQSGEHGKPGDCNLVLLVSKDDKSSNAKHRKLPLCETSPVCYRPKWQRFRQCCNKCSKLAPIGQSIGDFVANYTGDRNSVTIHAEPPHKDAQFWHIAMHFDLEKWSSGTTQINIPIEYEYNCDTSPTSSNCHCQNLCNYRNMLNVTILNVELNVAVFPNSSIHEGENLTVTCTSNSETEGWLFIKMTKSGSEYHCRPGIQYPQEFGNRTLAKGQHNCTLQIRNTQLSDGGRYECGFIFMNHLDEYRNFSHLSDKEYTISQTTKSYSHKDSAFYIAVIGTPVLVCFAVILTAVITYAVLAYRSRRVLREPVRDEEPAEVNPVHLQDQDPEEAPREQRLNEPLLRNQPSGSYEAIVNRSTESNQLRGEGEQ